jgi:hypothetical protein
MKSASPVTNMSSTLVGPLLPPYVAIPVQVMCAARGDCSPRLIARTWGVARGSHGVEELRRVGLDDTSPVGGQIELVDHEPGLLDGVGAGPMIPHRHRRQVSHDKAPVPVEVGAAVKPLGVGLLLRRDVRETVPDTRSTGQPTAPTGTGPKQVSDCGGSGSTYSPLPEVSL